MDATTATFDKRTRISEHSIVSREEWLPLRQELLRKPACPRRAGLPVRLEGRCWYQFASKTDSGRIEKFAIKRTRARDSVPMLGLRSEINP